MDIFGPIADNAGGIVEMSDQPANVSEATHRKRRCHVTTHFWRRLATHPSLTGTAARLLRCLLAHC